MFVVFLQPSRSPNRLSVSYNSTYGSWTVGSDNEKQKSPVTVTAPETRELEAATLEFQDGGDFIAFAVDEENEVEQGRDLKAKSHFIHSFIEFY